MDERKRAGINRECERMDKGSRGLKENRESQNCVTVDDVLFFFCMNEINHKERCLVSEVMTGIQENYDWLNVWLSKKGCEQDKILTLITFYCLCDQSALSLIGARAPSHGMFGNCNPLQAHE